MLLTSLSQMVKLSFSKVWILIFIRTEHIHNEDLKLNYIYESGSYYGRTTAIFTTLNQIWKCSSPLRGSDLFLFLFHI